MQKPTATIRPYQMPLVFGAAQGTPATLADPPLDESFPEEAANVLATAEAFNKHLYRPNTYLHKWWARRSGTTFRHILKQLVREPAKRAFLQPGGLEGTVVLDPMMGGGTTLHEALRLGASCIGVDVDPIPVLQAKASLGYQSLGEKSAVFAEFEHDLRSRIGAFYRTACPVCGSDCEVQFVLHALRRQCGCGEVAILDSLTLRHDNDGSVAICPECRDVFPRDSVHECDPSQRKRPPLIDRRQRICPICHEPYADLTAIPFYRRYLPVAIAFECRRHGRMLKRVDPSDIALCRKAEDAFAEGTSLIASDFCVPNGPKSRDLVTHGVSCYLDLFTRRQMLFLEKSIDRLRTVPEEHRLWLGLLLSTSLEFNALLCGYKGAEPRRPGAIRHVFSHHAYSFPYTALENNPVSSFNSSGTIGRLYKDRIERAGRWASMPIERVIKNGDIAQIPVKGEVDGGISVGSAAEVAHGTRRFYVVQGDFRSCHIPDDSVDYVVTDPPYYDSVQYSDLSSFFRVWLRKLLPSEADWEYNPCLAAVAQNASQRQAYGEVLGAIWTNCYRALRKPHGRLVFTFHHWNADAWAELSISLKRAGFRLTNRYVVFSENPISVHIRNLRALKHDCVLVLRPGIAQGTRWAEPSKVDCSESRSFCLDCGSALGFVLDSQMTEDEIRDMWRDLVGANGNGKTAG